MNSPQNKYKYLFFDLDMTLWDFETNAREAYKDIYKKFKLSERGIHNIDDFLHSYLAHNDRLWEQYRNGEIEKEFLMWRRFELTLLDFGIDDAQLAKAIGQDYITISPTKTNLFPNTFEILDYLKPRYPLFIITNGFEEVQFTKLKNSKLDNYFSHVITSEDAGCRKPNPCIFEYAFQKTGARPEQSLMIGDDLDVDIRGAQNSGMDGIFFNPKKLNGNGFVKQEISDLIELKKYL